MTRSMSSTWILPLVLLTGSSLLCGVTSCKTAAKNSTLRDSSRPAKFSELVARLEKEVTEFVDAPLGGAKVSNSSSPAMSLGDGDAEVLTAEEINALRQEIVAKQTMLEEAQRQSVVESQRKLEQSKAVTMTLKQVAEDIESSGEGATPADLEKLRAVLALLEASEAKSANSKAVFPRISAGWDSTCAITLDGVKCWGDGAQKSVPSGMIRPMHVSVGSYASCALDQDGVKCWGQNSVGEATVPRLNQPRQVSTGSQHTCALDQDGVKCWGQNSAGQTTVPRLNRPKQVSSGGQHTCAIDQDSVKCWGRNSEGQTRVPRLNQPRQVSAGGYHTCALDQDGVKCWGEDSQGRTSVPPLNQPRQVSAGGFTTCALDQDGVKCWGDPLGGGHPSMIPSLNNPIEVSAGAYHICAIDQDGVKCWGSNNSGQCVVPSGLAFAP